MPHVNAKEALGSSESEPAGRPRGKRARAVEVHNLSEKRRRCKINEKMKALQSLVPNSSKRRRRLLLQTDKASMLDDAIGYLKHLQLQVQILGVTEKAEKDEIVKSAIELRKSEIEDGYTEVSTCRQALLLDVRDKLLFEQEYAGSTRAKEMDASSWKRKTMKPGGYL